MKTAIIGSGISGLTVADAISQFHDLSVFEAVHYIGGHTNTIDVVFDDKQYAIDTGFIVFNDRTYPNFVSMLNRLNVESQPAPMTFSVRCDRTNLEYRGADLSGLFAQKRNLFRVGFYRFLYEIVRFNREATEFLQHGDATESVVEYFARSSYSSQFYEKYFLPLGSAIWSCPKREFEQFPIRFIIEFYHHHGLLSLNDRPQWRVICGGSRQYVNELARPFADRIRLNSPVHSVNRTEEGVYVETRDGFERFDHVVFACHSDQALRILGDQATATERNILGALRYEPNEAVLHFDESTLPKRRRAWAAWNYHISADDSDKASLTYNMNILQSIKSTRTFCVTLNGTHRIDPNKIIRSLQYAHPVFDSRQRQAQDRFPELLGANRSSFCGAYWRNGFHEDGVVSGLSVAKYLLSKPWNEKLYLRGSRVASAV